VPNLNKYLAELDYQVREDGVTLEDGLEDAKYVLYNDMTYNWRAFRVAHSSNLNLFDKSEMDLKCPGKSLLQAWRSKRKPKNGIESAMGKRRRLLSLWYGTIVEFISVEKIDARRIRRLQTTKARGRMYIERTVMSASTVGRHCDTIYRHSARIKNRSCSKIKS
jgi:hypothetical protein